MCKYSMNSRYNPSSCLLAVLAFLFQGSKFLVHLQSFASNIFFQQQTGETTSKFFPFEMSMTTSDIKIRTDISHILSMS